MGVKEEQLANMDVKLHMHYIQALEPRKSLTFVTKRPFPSLTDANDQRLANTDVEPCAAPYRLQKPLWGPVRHLPAQHYSVFGL
jgi:hypothetical protein